MRNPQILGARLPRDTYWLLPGADTASTGTDAGANSGTDGGASSGIAAGAESGTAAGANLSTDGGANSGTGATAGGAFHLTLDCLGRRLPFVLDFQGSALVLVVRLFFRACTPPDGWPLDHLGAWGHWGHLLGVFRETSDAVLLICDTCKLDAGYQRL